MSVLSLSY